jgi:amino acid permease
MRIGDLIPLAIVLGVLVVVLVPGLCYVRKTTGRSLHDMLAVLGGAITLILLMMLPLIFFRDQIDSPNRSIRSLTEKILIAVYLPIAVVITWGFNKLAKHHSKLAKREHKNHHSIGKANSPDSR